MVHHIRAQDSNYETLDDVDAFTGTGPDTLIVDNGASLIASGASADGAFLLDPWTATINGVVAGLATGSFGISLHETNNNNSTASTIKIGASGDVFGDDTGIFVAYSTGNDHVSVTNLGIVSGGTNSIFSPVQTLVRNAGLLDGSVVLGAAADGFINSAKSGKHVKAGTALGLVDLGGGDDTLINPGTIRGQVNLGDNNDTLMNSGLIRGTVQLGDGNDVFNDFLKVGAHIKSGIVDRGIVLGVAAAIDLGAGDDIFNGGKNAESVRDDLGTDTYKFGAGNDLFLADDDFANSENDGNDIVNGGRGIDTYNLTGADTLYFINLDTKVHFGLEAQTAVELFGQTDRVIGFENVVGGTIADSIVGSGGANSLNGSGGGDQLCGLGGRDVLTGGSGADTFVFLTLADSGIKASTRDVITDFIAGSGDIIDLSAIDANGNAAGDPALQLHWLESFQRRAWRAQGVVQQRQYHHLRRREWRRQGRFLHRVDRICLIERRGLPFVRDRAREETDPLTHGRRRGRPTQGL